MISCPHCSQPLAFEPYVEYNAANHDKPVLGRAQCCGKGVTVSRVVSLRYSAYEGTAQEDDWGVPLQ